MDEARVERFTRTERAVHWVQAASFLALLITGFALMSPQIEGLFGHRELLREIHLSGAFFLFFGPAIVALAGNRASVARDVKAVDTWDADDLRWLIPFPVLRLFGVSTPPQGRFNAGQKLNAIFVTWSTLTFTVTGLIMWQNRRFPLNLVDNANTIHTFLAYVALVAFLGHISLATWYPSTRHALRAMVSGWVRRDWALHHHAKWVQAAPAQFAAPRYDAIRTVIQILAGSFAALFAVRFLFFWLGANTTDAVTSWLYAVTAWPGVAGIIPATATRIADWPAVLYAILLIVAWRLADRTRRLVQSAEPQATFHPEAVSVAPSRKT
ncbi:MAG TPA: cytochrome b/b6 domain-containing protein [Chloroflexota bacterium]|nr:cytochrome b/b6 domain-containing protein [Chloroflexota bacterium]